ncbi:hypothetical protein [Bradyrhizobium sp. SZCCHNRI2010]|uniref:hypothetical protein n=1 Tax=Bradyrhizobium sp. SZCCHNRI2010 TaxID=3057283 RepID=UPI0028E9E1A1|nr:hypothetical protein [Bradyrhizobium sp. SZCCHNRI2010]
MPKKCRSDNITFVSDLMNHSQYGALAQIFVIDALSKWSEIIAKTDPVEIDSPMINGQSWVAVAKEIKQKIEERLA